MPFIIEHPKIEIVAFPTQGEKTGSDILRLDNLMLSAFYVRSRYESYRDAWYRKTMFLSSLMDITEDVDFQRIIALGKEAIPLIIQDIRKSPNALVIALNAITNASIKSNKKLTISELCQAWIKLYDKGGLHLN